MPAGKPAMTVLGEPAWRRAIKVWAAKWFGPSVEAAPDLSDKPVPVEKPDPSRTFARELGLDY